MICIFLLVTNKTCNIGYQATPVLNVEHADLVFACKTVWFVERRADR